MTNKINMNIKISDFIDKYPQSEDIFKNFGLDASEFREKNITKAAKEKHIVKEDLVASLEKAIATKTGKSKNTEWENKSLSEIIDYVEKKHHGFLWQKLPPTDMLLDKLIVAQGERHHEFVMGVKRIFSELKDLLETHLINEEEALFDVIKNLEKHPKQKMNIKANLNDLIAPLYKEHDATKEILAEMRCFTSEYEIPEYAVSQFQEIFDNLKEIESDLHEHIYVENVILLPRIREKLK